MAAATAFSVPTFTPSLPDTTINAVSAARMPSATPPAKSKSPGVSMRLIFVFFHSTGATAVIIDVCLFISSLSKSRIVLPSETLPKRSLTFERYKIDSATEVFPHPL